MRIRHVAPLLLMSLCLGCDSEAGNETVEGIWQGSLQYPGFESRVAFVVTALPDGTFKGAMARPDESDVRVPATVRLGEGRRVRFEVDSVGGCFDGTLPGQDGVMKGQWSHGRWSQPLVLKKVTEIVAPRRPQTPLPPYPYDAQDLTFTNETGGARLAGTLTRPRTNGLVPAVILISGVGAHDRDYSIMRHRPFLVLADSLTRRGVAVLRFDDRGVGRSTGDRLHATSADYAQDVLAGVRCLRNHARIDPNRIGLIGHSEGGTIAMLAAAESEEVALIVLMGTPGLSGREYNLQFEESTARAMGLGEAAVVAKRSFQDRALSIVLAGDDPTVAEAELRRLYEDLPVSMPAEKIEAAIRRLLSPWFRFSLRHDPAATLARVHCPVLAIFGAKDVQVPADGNLEAIRRALHENGNEDYRVEEIPGLNHFFQTAPTGSPAEYGRIEETISPIVLERLGAWIVQRTR